MDEALEVVDLLADSGLEGPLSWILRVLGIFLLLTGLGIWLLTDIGLLPVPAFLLVAGVVLLVVPELLLTVAELGG